MTIKLITNGRIHTLDADKPLVQTVVVRDGRIIDLGSHQDMLLQWGRTGTEIIDLQGRMASPGLIDSHMHLCGIALFALSLDLTNVRSKAELLAKVRERAARTPPGQWVVGRGWDENLFADGAAPDISELDQAAPHCPVYLARVCCHAALTNSKALEIAGYHPHMSIAPGGAVILDEASGEPTGLLKEAATEIVTRHIPDYTYAQLKDAVRYAMNVAMQSGLTSVHTEDTRYLGGLEQTWRIYRELIHEEGMRLRCNHLVYYPYIQNMAESGLVTGYGDEFLQIGAVKIFADGVLGGRTALLSQPYHDAPEETGEAVLSREELTAIVREARQYGLPVAVHAIGDQALENVLDALDQFPAANYRDRLIHVMVLRPDLVKRLISPSRMADIQPRFVVGDFPWVIERLGKERVERAYAWKTLLAAGVICAGGSDAPVEPVQPLLGLHAAVTRKKPHTEHNGWNSAEKLTMAEALRLFTVGGAMATGEERHKGTLSRGKLADLTVYSQDILAIEPDELLNTRIEQTIIHGEVYENQEGETAWR